MIKLTMDNYMDDSLYPYKADYEMPEKEYKKYIEKLKKGSPNKSTEELEKLHKRKFSAFAMEVEAFKDKYFRVYKNPKYKSPHGVTGRRISFKN